MSPSLWFARGRIFSYLEEAALTPGKIYLDTGTREGTDFVADRLLSARLNPYRTSAHAMYDLLYHKGYRPGQDLLYVEEEGGLHHESAWARRLPEALQFLLGGSG
jgi:predicted alpha/beta superfamily hydrolase